jgi:hypothetical protein
MIWLGLLAAVVVLGFLLLVIGPGPTYLVTLAFVSMAVGWCQIQDTRRARR